MHGRRRATQVLKGRILNGVRRAQRVAIRPIGRQGRAFIAGAAINRAMLYGSGVTGISEGDIRKLRSAVTKAVAPNRAAMRCVRATLALACTQEIGPVVLGPMSIIGIWATLVWKKERTRRKHTQPSLSTHSHGKKSPKGTHGISGPMGPLCQAVVRLGWAIQTAGELTDKDRYTWDLTRHAPAGVQWAARRDGAKATWGQSANTKE